MSVMFRIVLTVSCVLLFPVLAFSESLPGCPEPFQVTASYHIKSMGPEGKTTQEGSIELWRFQQQVAIHYPDKEITELWEQTKNQQLHLVRYFDHYQRGIEYQPAEIKGSHDWSVKQQFIANDLIASMTLQKTTGSGCQQVQYYSLQQDGRQIELQWLPQLSLMQLYKMEQAGVVTTWKLEQINHDKNRIGQRFAQLAGFDTTDYTDVGDNESDPFLLKMINLGFVEHAASGFYDAQGNAMGGHHGH